MSSNLQWYGIEIIKGFCVFLRTGQRYCTTEDHHSLKTKRRKHMDGSCGSNLSAARTICATALTDTQNSGRLGQRAMTNSKSWYFHTHSHDVIIALKILNLVSDDEVHSCSLYLIHPFPVCAVSKLNSVVPLGCWSTITCIALLYLLFGDRKSTKNLKNNNARTYRLFKLPSAKCRCQK